MVPSLTDGGFVAKNGPSVTFGTFIFFPEELLTTPAFGPSIYALIIKS